MDTRHSVLGISPGTRTVGIVIFRGGKLIDWQLKTFHGPWSKVKLVWIMSALKQTISYYGITYLAVKVPHPSRTSKALNELTKTIYKMSEKQGLPIKAFTLTELEQTFSGKATKKELIEQLAARFPELREYHEKTATPKNPFEKVFEAVAAALNAS